MNNKRNRLIKIVFVYLCLFTIFALLGCDKKDHEILKLKQESEIEFELDKTYNINDYFETNVNIGFSYDKKILDVDEEGNITIKKLGYGEIAIDKIKLNDTDNQEENNDNLSVKLKYHVKENVGFDIASHEKIVAINYSTWFIPVYEQYGDEPYNISDILKNGGKFGPSPEFHYWGKPEIGYYSSDDKTVIRRHMNQLNEAGIDFIIVDNTNAVVDWGYNENKELEKDTYWDKMVTRSCTALLDTIVEMREEGLKTPYVAMWCMNNTDSSTCMAIYRDFYLNEKYQDCFVYWDQKYFMLTTSRAQLDLSGIVSTKRMWGLEPTHNSSSWSFLQQENEGLYDKYGNCEQVPVCVAAQRNYMTNTSTAKGRNHGITFYEQWKTAFELQPHVVVITWWNEWVAQNFGSIDTPSFVDNYNYEYSRDIEPASEGHKDTYYKWMCEYIKCYRNNEPCPRLVEEGY